MGPRNLTCDKTKDYFYICKDAFDLAVYAEFHAGNTAELVLSFLISAWQHLGLPQHVWGRIRIHLPSSTSYGSQVWFYTGAFVPGAALMESAPPGRADRPTGRLH